MQPPPPPRRRRRSTRAAGPSRPAKAETPAAVDPLAGARPVEAAPRGRRTPPDPPDDIATAAYRVVDDTVGEDDRPGAPVVPPSPPAADGPRRPTRSPGGSGQDPGRFGRWPTGGRRSRPAREEAGERSLRALVTSRTTQVPPSVAMRAREVELPTTDDLARAEEELTIVRRNYVPPTALATGRRSTRGRGERPGEERGRRRTAGGPLPPD